MPTSKKKTQGVNQLGAPQLPSQFLVLWKIFSFVGLEDLKSCRLVCKNWNEVAAMIIPQFSEVRLHCLRKTNTIKANSKPISQFCKFLKASSKLPSSPFRVINIRIARLGANLKYCDCKRTAGSLASDSCSTCYVLYHCGKTVKTAKFEKVPSSYFKGVMNRIFLFLRNVETLELTCISDGHSISRDPTSVLDELQDLSSIFSLKKFILETASEFSSETYVSTFHWTTFWKMFPQISDLQLKVPLRPLNHILFAAAVRNEEHPPIRSLNINVVEDNLSLVVPSELDGQRRSLAQILRGITIWQRLEELTLDANLSVSDWSFALEHLPSTLRRLSISSNWCMGTDYMDNPLNQLTREDSTNKFLRILKGSTSNLKNFAVHFQGARGVDTTIRLQPSTLTFEFIQDLSWIFVRKFSNSWESLFPGGFQELAAVFPNLRRLEATVGTKKAFHQLCTTLPGLEELTISKFSRIKLSDQDIIGDGLSSSGKPSRKSAKNPGITAFKKLRSLKIRSDCSNLTDESIFHGFLKIPDLVILELSDAPEFGAAAHAALEMNFFSEEFLADNHSD